MRGHRPKLAALTAYEADLLSAAGRRRVEAHLASCSICREALGAMRVYDELVEGIRGLEAVEPDWSRMELGLRREARARSQEIRAERRVGGASLAALAVAAAATIVVFNAPWTGGEPERDLDAAAASAPAPRRTAITGALTATAGTVLDDTWPAEERPLAAGAPVDEGMGLAVGDRSEAHVRFYEGTGAILHAGTRVRIEELREARVVLGLARGTVSNAVAHLGAGDRYEVRAGPWAVAVRGTRFAVRHVEGELSVAVVEGVVEVSYLGRLVRRLEAPSYWTSDGLDGLQTADVALPHALSAESASWPVLRVAEVEGVTGWQIGEQRMPAPGALSMRAPRGDVPVVGYAGDEIVLRTVVAVLAGGTFVEPPPIAPGAPAIRTGTLAPELIAPTVRAGLRRLRDCKQRADRSGPDAFGRFMLRITIGRTGEVQNAQLVPRGTHFAPPAFTACVLSEARSWSFPAPTGGIVRFEQPLTFATRVD